MFGCEKRFLSQIEQNFAGFSVNQDKSQRCDEILDHCCIEIFLYIIEMLSIDILTYFRFEF